jgi:hypothetical protein
MSTKFTSFFMLGGVEEFTSLFNSYLLRPLLSSFIPVKETSVNMELWRKMFFYCDRVFALLLLEWFIEIIFDTIQQLYMILTKFVLLYAQLFVVNYYIVS